jgi:hypothetical protein
MIGKKVLSQTIPTVYNGEKNFETTRAVKVADSYKIQQNLISSSLNSTVGGGINNTNKNTNGSLKPVNYFSLHNLNNNLSRNNNNTSGDTTTTTTTTTNSYNSFNSASNLNNSNQNNQNNENSTSNLNLNTSINNHYNLNFKKKKFLKQQSSPANLIDDTNTAFEDTLLNNHLRKRNFQKYLIERHIKQFQNNTKSLANSNKTTISDNALNLSSDKNINISNLSNPINKLINVFSDGNDLLDRNDKSEIDKQKMVFFII